MTDQRRRLGQAGEQLAAQKLSAYGYQILERNWRYGRRGEIDLVAQDGECLVIVEVRTRRGRRFGTAEESVTPRKQAQLQTLTEAYYMQSGWDGPVRIDVVAVSLSPQGDLIEINHIKNAV
ncbi:MAG: YraN family protein [Anaerolineae bacterium]|nr:YraN family protein [Anaerolineae bacterium]MCB0199292.1 YraN family protein [Anaerolineae bacterium]